MSTMTAMWSTPVDQMKKWSEFAESWESWKYSRILTDYTLLETEIINLPEYVGYMRIHEDFPMVLIKSHNCVHGM